MALNANKIQDLSSLLRKLREEISPKRVHRLRVDIRRIESLIAYSHPSLNRKEEKAVQEMSLLRKRAGKVRDMDVQLALLGRAFANGSTTADRRTLTDILKKRRARQAGRLATMLKKLDHSKFVSRARRIVGESGSAPANPEMNLLTPLETAKAQLAALAAKPPARFEVNPAALHQVRIRLKLIRYLAELSEKSAEQDQFLLNLKAAQDALGEWHDWEELTGTVEKYFGDRLSCALLVEARSLFAVRHAAAVSAAKRLLAAYAAAPPRKQPRPARLAVVAARRA